MSGTHSHTQQPVILIVDDRCYIRSLLREFLRPAFPGSRIVEAADGRRGMAFIRECRPQVVLMDISLPDANGIELTAQAKALHPDTRVIMVTQHREAPYMEHARAAGAFGYVVKDSIYTELLPLVARALGSAPSHDIDGSPA